MPTQLSIYNGALRSVGERKLATLTENREPRRLLDDVWDNDLINTVLQEGQWDFAARSVKLDANPSYEDEIDAFKYGFDKPDDFIRTMGISDDGYFVEPKLNYLHENNRWWSDNDTLYVRYVSNDVEYGNDMSLWPPNFTRYVEHYVGLQILPSLTQGQGAAGGYGKMPTQERKVHMALKKARNTDAMEKPAKFQPRGRWARARGGSGGGEGGLRGILGVWSG